MESGLVRTSAGYVFLLRFHFPGKLQMYPQQSYTKQEKPHSGSNSSTGKKKQKQTLSWGLAWLSLKK